MSKLAQAVQDAALVELNNDIQAMIDSIELLPEKLSEKIDPVIQDKVNAIVDAADAAQEHVKELQESNKRAIQKNLNDAQTDFIVATKDSIDRLLQPQIDKLSAIPDAIAQLSTTIVQPQKSTSSNMTIIIVLCLSLIVGALVAGLATQHYYSKVVEHNEIQMTIMSKIMDTTLDNDMTATERNKFRAAYKENMYPVTKQVMKGQ
ncbi:hypothetical protein VII00023_23019 [Vibrio ichthyoenteri ATCC 700023]|uniref:Uncharacterized protein n=1 Tax=Vibrio ichthyoenteri ATCC 700023 TaxID=870968 RepID=F9S7K9_9VIBR|nr:hypothetical protein [Vibrio ichthyoenteri]EGU31305.1 hypothetical protein VII00023_23019 [Vibrio ichthyoenteri ATCC 700023]